jgi:hypothetical protein
LKVGDPRVGADARRTRSAQTSSEAVSDVSGSLAAAAKASELGLPSTNPFVDEMKLRPVDLDIDQRSIVLERQRLPSCSGPEWCNDDSCHTKMSDTK